MVVIPNESCLLASTVTYTFTVILFVFIIITLIIIIIDFGDNSDDGDNAKTLFITGHSFFLILVVNKIV